MAVWFFQKIPERSNTVNNRVIANKKITSLFKYSPSDLTGNIIAAAPNARNTLAKLEPIIFPRPASAALLRLEKTDTKSSGADVQKATIVDDII